MRGARSLLVLVVVLAGLGAYIYFVESKKPAGGEGEETKPKVFTVVADTIEEIDVAAAGGRTTLRKSGADWNLVAPVAARADAAEVSGIATNLATLEKVRVVDENPSDLAQYGLAEPRIDIGFRAAGEKSTRHLLVGDKTATGGEMYAKVGGTKPVFLVAAFLDGTFNRGTFDLRDKTALAFDREKVERLVLQPAGAALVELALAGGEWSLVQPLQAGADYGTVEGIVGRLQSAQMKSIVEQEAADLKAYGLDKPQLTATLVAGSARTVLQLGAQADEATVYAKDVARPMVFTLESAVLDELKKPADELRRKDLFAARSYGVTAVEVARGAEVVAFEKVKGKGPDAADTWRETKPAAKTVEASKLDTLLTKLTALRATGWAAPAAKTGLESPFMVVTLRSDEGKRDEKVSFGRSGPDVYAAVAGQPGSAKVDAAGLDDAVKALDALK